jgi:hypothetical protein
MRAVVNHLFFNLWSRYKGSGSSFSIFVNLTVMGVVALKALFLFYVRRLTCQKAVQRLRSSPVLLALQW